MTSCGTCVCPTPQPTPELSDLCAQLNATHVVCNMSGGFISYKWAIFEGMCLCVVLIIVMICIYSLFIDPGRDKK